MARQESNMATKHKARRRVKTLRWLKDTKRTQDGWAQELGVDDMTVYFWLHKGTKPQPLYLDRIRERTPECPILLEYAPRSS
jgi:hypothetical protein